MVDYKSKRTGDLLDTLVPTGATYYYYKYTRTKELKEYYLNYLRNDQPNILLQNKQQIIQLFEEAGLKDFSVYHIDQVSISKGFRHELSGFSNITLRRTDITNIIKSRFEEAIGVFRHRIQQSFNPIYWIEFILKFPEKIFSYINLSLPNSIMKVIQLIYWVVGFLVALDKFKIINIHSWIN